jgi:hypothetical protein
VVSIVCVTTCLSFLFGALSSSTESGERRRGHSQQHQGLDVTALMHVSGFQSTWVSLAQRVIIAGLAISSATMFGLERPWLHISTTQHRSLFVNTGSTPATVPQPERQPAVQGPHPYNVIHGVDHGVSSFFLNHSTPLRSTLASGVHLPTTVQTVTMPRPLPFVIIWNIGCFLVGFDTVVRLLCCYKRSRHLNEIREWSRPVKQHVWTVECDIITHWALLVLLLVYSGIERLAHHPRPQTGYTSWLLCTDLLVVCTSGVSVFIWIYTVCTGLTMARVAPGAS